MSATGTRPPRATRTRAGRPPGRGPLSAVSTRQSRRSRPKGGRDPLHTTRTTLPLAARTALSPAVGAPHRHSKPEAEASQETLSAPGRARAGLGRAELIADEPDTCRHRIVAWFVRPSAREMRQCCTPEADACDLAQALPAHCRHIEGIKGIALPEGILGPIDVDKQGAFLDEDENSGAGYSKWSVSRFARLGNDRRDTQAQRRMRQDLAAGPIGADRSDAHVALLLVLQELVHRQTKRMNHARRARVVMARAHPARSPRGTRRRFRPLLRRRRACG